MQCKYSFKKIRFLFGPVLQSRLLSNPTSVLPASTPKTERQQFARRPKLAQQQTHASNHHHNVSQQHKSHDSRDASLAPSCPPIESLSHEYIVRNLTKAFEHRKKLETEGILESDPNSAFRAVNHVCIFSECVNCYVLTSLLIYLFAYFFSLFIDLLIYLFIYLFLYLFILSALLCCFLFFLEFIVYCILCWSSFLTARSTTVCQGWSLTSMAPMHSLF
jgi:hypothetical protein